MDDQVMEPEKAERLRDGIARAKDTLPKIHRCTLEIEDLMHRFLDSHSESDLPRTGLAAFARKTQKDWESIRNLLKPNRQSDWVFKGDNDAALRLMSQLHDAVSSADQALFRWDVLKRCRRLVALAQTFYDSTSDDRRQDMDEGGVSGPERQRVGRMLKSQAKIKVDVVDNGREWIFIKAASPKRLAQEMTEGGWQWDTYETDDVVDPEEWEEVRLGQIVRRLVDAARLNRCEYQFPRIRVILTSACWGNKELDILFRQIANIDPLVRVTIEDPLGEFLRTPPPPPSEAIGNLLGDVMEDLTPTLNLDHTILIDLISDITYYRLTPYEWQSPSTRSQIEEENSQEGGAMVKKLLPLLEGRQLVCTAEAAEHFHDVLRTVGTRTEKARGRLLVPYDEQTRSMSDQEIQAAFRSLSHRHIPATIQLPVKILPETWTLSSVEAAVQTGKLPRVAVEVARRSGWKSARLSIFMYGWASGNVTLTSNKEIKGRVRTMVEEWRVDEEEMGPRIWKFGVTRNLLAKNATPRGETPDGDC